MTPDPPCTGSSRKPFQKSSPRPARPQIISIGNRPALLQKKSELGLPVNSRKRVSLVSRLESTPSFGWAFLLRGLEWIFTHSGLTSYRRFYPAQICRLFIHLRNEPPQPACFHTLAQCEKLSALFSNTCAWKSNEGGGISRRAESLAWGLKRPL
jgi:hypothetical protein